MENVSKKHKTTTKKAFIDETVILMMLIPLVSTLCWTWAALLRCLWPSAFCCTSCGHDRLPRHARTAVTSAGGLQAHQRLSQSLDTKAEGRKAGTRANVKRPGLTLNQTKSLCVPQIRTLNITSCLCGLSLYNTKRKQQELDESQSGAHHSGALVIYPAKTTSQRCTHQWGCVSEAILQMSLLCALSPGWAGHCVCVIDPRRHRRPPVIFQQLFPLCSCTAADRTLQIMLIATTTVCVAVQRDLVPVVTVKHNRGTRGTLHLSLWILSAQRKRRSTAQVTCAFMVKDELDAVIIQDKNP